MFSIVEISIQGNARKPSAENYRKELQITRIIDYKNLSRLLIYFDSDQLINDYELMITVINI